MKNKLTNWTLYKHPEEVKKIMPILKSVYNKYENSKRIKTISDIKSYFFSKYKILDRYNQEQIFHEFIKITQFGKIYWNSEFEKEVNEY